MLVYLDEVNRWEAGTAGRMTYNQFVQRFDIAKMDNPIKYITQTTKKQDDTEALKMAFNALKTQGVANPSLAQAAAVVARSN
jgi:4-hydroxy-3-methylbut-2-enyl diphosphate reductase IspH